ncbi:MAG: DUF4124 domain-containing protein [Methylococcales bacterium]
MNKTTFCILMITLLFCPQVFSATLTIDKWTDDQGKYHYGQRPAGSKVQLQQDSSGNKNEQKNKSTLKKAPSVYKKPQTRHKNPKDYSRNAS